MHNTMHAALEFITVLLSLVCVFSSDCNSVSHFSPELFVKSSVNVPVYSHRLYFLTVLRPFFQVHLGELVLSQRRDLLEQPLDFYEPDVLPAINL